MTPTLPDPLEFSIPEDEVMYTTPEDRLDTWIGAYPDGPMTSYSLGSATFIVNGMHGPGLVVKLTPSQRAAVLENIKRMVVRLTPLPVEVGKDGSPLPQRYRQEYLDRSLQRQRTVVNGDGTTEERLVPAYTRSRFDYPLACHLFMVDASKRHDYHGGRPPRLTPIPEHVAPLLEAHLADRARRLQQATTARIIPRTA